MSEICHHIIQLLRQTKYMFFRIKNQTIFLLSFAKTSDNILARLYSKADPTPPPPLLYLNFIGGFVGHGRPHTKFTIFILLSTLPKKTYTYGTCQVAQKQSPYPKSSIPPFLKILHPSLIKRIVRETFVASGRKL